MYVETKGPTLEELAKLIDGDDANVPKAKQVESELVVGRSYEELPEKL